MSAPQVVVLDLVNVLVFPEERELLNRTLLERLSAQVSDIRWVIFTSSLPSQARIVLEEYPFFETVYSTINLQSSKREIRAYEKLAHLLKVAPDEVVFIDDSLVNINAAQAAGVSRLTFVSNDQLVQDLAKLGIHI